MNIRKFLSAFLLACIISSVFEPVAANATQIIDRPDLIMPPRQRPAPSYPHYRDPAFERRERERREQARWEAERRERERRERERRDAERRERERRDWERRERERRDWEREQYYRWERERRDWERYERERRDYERREQKRREDELAIEIIGEIIKEGMREEAAKERRRTRY